MDDKGYISSMLAVNSVLFQVNATLSIGKNDNKSGGRHDFCKKFAGNSVIDPALYAMLKAVYELMCANDMKPEKYVDELKKLVPGEAFNKMEIGNGTVRYGINRAKRINGVMRFMTRHKLMSEKAIGKLEDAETRSAIEAIKSTKKTVSALSKFENDYVKLKEGYDKPDSPFLLIKRYTEILQKNDKAAKEGKQIKLGDGEYVKQIEIEKKTYKMIRHADSTVSVVDNDGNSQNVKDEKEAEQLIEGLRKGDSLIKPEKDKKTAEDKKVKKPAEKKVPVTKEEEKKEEPVEGPKDKKEENTKEPEKKPEEKKEEKKVEEPVEGPKDKKEEENTKEPEKKPEDKKEEKKAEEPVEGLKEKKEEENTKEPEKEPEDKKEEKTQEEFRKFAVSGEQIYKEEAPTHFTPEYIRKKLEDIRFIFVTKGTKDTGKLKKLMKNPEFKKNSDAWNKFFEEDGGTEYKQMALTLNECISLLSGPKDENWSEGIKDAVGRLKKAANTYRITHKSILSVLGTSQHVTKAGDVRMAAAMQLMYETSVYEKMLEAYIDNGNKDIKRVPEGEEKKETQELNEVMDERNDYIRRLFKDKLALSPSQMQLLVSWAGDESFVTDKSGNITGLPKDPLQKAMFIVAVMKLRKLMTGNLTPEQIMSMTESDFVNKGFDSEVKDVINNPKYARFFKTAKSAKKAPDGELTGRLTDMSANSMFNESRQTMEINKTATAKKMTDLN